ncbi:MAG: thiopurine S-methyltransferase [Pseudomonadota bacterium]
MSFRAWNERWESGRIGFHETNVNGSLAAYWTHVNPGQRVLVPLCGKSVDLIWLAERGHQVVGVEFVESAVAAFFAEANWRPVIETVAGGRRYSHRSITIYAADIFALDPRDVGPCDTVYDRAAVVALPTDQRSDYATAVLGLLRPTANGLVITLEYDQAQMSGPPYAVPANELFEIFGSSVRWTCLQRDTAALEQNPKFAERGVARLDEIVWSMQRTPLNA